MPIGGILRNYLVYSPHSVDFKNCPKYLTDFSQSEIKFSVIESCDFHLKIDSALDIFMGFPSSSDGKPSACSAGDPGLIPGSGGSPGEGNGNPLQYSRLENFIEEPDGL